MLAVPQHNAPHVPYAEAVHQDTPGGYGGELLHILVIDLQHIADVADIDIGGVHSHRDGQPCIFTQVLLLAMERDEIFRLCDALDDFEFLLAGVAGHMHFIHGFVNHFAAPL